jgi:hypothetical protein
MGVRGTRRGHNHSIRNLKAVEERWISSSSLTTSDQEQSHSTVNTRRWQSATPMFEPFEHNRSSIANEPGLMLSRTGAPKKGWECLRSQSRSAPRSAATCGGAATPAFRSSYLIKLSSYAQPNLQYEDDAEPVEAVVYRRKGPVLFTQACAHDLHNWPWPMRGESWACPRWA